jgi:hypothetical protein
MATTVIMELPKDLRRRIFPCCHVSSLPGIKLPVVACCKAVVRLNRDESAPTPRKRVAREHFFFEAFHWSKGNQQKE